MRLSILKAATAAAAFAPQVVDSQPDPNYPVNNQGQPEYASVILTLDHLLDSSGFHVHQKAVYSTETAREALASLITRYYPSINGRQPVLDNATYEIFKALDSDPVNNIALYFVPVDVKDRRGGLIAQVVLSNVALQNLVAAPAFGNGSALLATNALVNAVIDLATLAMQKTGNVPSLMLMQLDDDAPDLKTEKASFESAN